MSTSDLSLRHSEPSLPVSQLEYSVADSLTLLSPAIAITIGSSCLLPAFLRYQQWQKQTTRYQ